MNAPRGCLALALLALAGRAAPVDDVLRAAGAAEAAWDARGALALYLEADVARPRQVPILQKIARQYSDLVADQPDDAARRDYAERALDYATRATELDPSDPVSVLSQAIARGKLATYSDTRTRVLYSRQIRAEAERALALDPQYAWAHHILGRWHREVANLGPAARGVARLLYGGLPPASVAEAVAHLQRAVALEPDELNHHLELGFALAAAGKPEEARAAWRTGLAMPARSRHDDVAKRAARAALEAAGG